MVATIANSDCWHCRSCWCLWLARLFLMLFDSYAVYFPLVPRRSCCRQVSALLFVLLHLVGCAAVSIVASVKLVLLSAPGVVSNVKALASSAKQPRPAPWSPRPHGAKHTNAMRGGLAGWRSDGAGGYGYGRTRRACPSSTAASIHVLIIVGAAHDCMNTAERCRRRWRGSSAGAGEAPGLHYRLPLPATGPTFFVCV